MSLRIAAILVASLLVAACGGAPTAVSTGAPAASATTAPAASAAASPAASLTPLKVRIVAASDTLSYMDTWVSRYGGTFEKAGLDVTWLPSIPDAAQATAALLGGSADVLEISVAGPFNAAAAGRVPRIFATGSVGFTNFITLSKAKADELAKQGITPQSPVADRLKALRGLVVGTGSAGGPAEIALVKAMEAVGLDAYKEVKMQAGTPDAMSAAFKASRMDAILTSVPGALEPVLASYGVLWISGPAGDVPIWNKGYTQVWVTTEQYAKEHKDVLDRVVAGLQATTKMITEDPNAALAALKKKYETLDADLLKASFEASKKSYSIDRKVRRSVMQDTIDSYNAGVQNKLKLTPADVTADGYLVQE